MDLLGQASIGYDTDLQPGATVFVAQEVEKLTGNVVNKNVLIGTIRNDEGKTVKFESLEIFSGDNRDIEISVVDETGAVVDLTGSSVLMSVKKFIKDVSYVFQKSSATPAEITITNPTGGVFVVFLVPADTQLLAAGLYEFDVQLTTAADKVFTVVRGQLKIKRDVT